MKNCPTLGVSHFYMSKHKKGREGGKPRRKEGKENGGKEKVRTNTRGTSQSPGHEEGQLLF